MTDSYHLLLATGQARPSRLAVPGQGLVVYLPGAGEGGGSKTMALDAHSLRARFHCIAVVAGGWLRLSPDQPGDVAAAAVARLC